MTQVQNIFIKNETNSNQESENRFETCEEIVLELINEGISANFNPDSFILDISKKYNITLSEAKSCIKMAICRLETNSNDKTLSKKFNDNNSYFWVTGYTNASEFKPKNDGMDSLVSFSNYKRAMFGIK